MEPVPKPILRDFPDELTGPRVLIRPVRPGDGAVIFEAVDEAREQIAPWLPWVEKTRSADDSEEAVRRGSARWQTREDLMVGIWEKSTGRYLGGSGLHRIDWAVPAFEIGYWLRTSAWGQGYVTETVQVLCEFAFETLGANRVEIRCDPRNTRSRAVPERLGFVLEATLRNHVRDGAGELRDTLIFALTLGDYTQAKPLWH
jgi:RimJ/RimL family protein N-acetyltransferase